ncbi:hypothetical protein B0H17DRAFT_1301745, partial [Mycena rosella]
MLFVPKSAQNSPAWTQHSAVLSLSRVVQATAALPNLTTNEVKTAILDRSLRWEIARSHLLIYSWYRDTGPQLAKTLMDLHRTDYETPYGGYPAVHRSHPAFSGLVHHIVSYVASEAARNHAAKKAKLRPTNSIPRNRNKLSVPANPHSPLQIELAKLPFLPYDLRGLRDAPSSSTRHIPITMPRSNVALKSIEAIYSCSSAIIQDIWSKELILPPLVSMDKGLAGGHQKPDDLNLV